EEQIKPVIHLQPTKLNMSGTQDENPPPPLERITKKRTKNKAKTTKSDSEWKSRKRQSQNPSPSVEKSTQVNPDKSKRQHVKKNKFEG
ncbi:hypothetical protein Tco_0177494, partial [Tanacetum coccineum]